VFGAVVSLAVALVRERIMCMCAKSVSPSQFAQILCAFEQFKMGLSCPRFARPANLRDRTLLMSSGK
jgi:hypothetical protein